MLGQGELGTPYNVSRCVCPTEVIRAHARQRQAWERSLDTTAPERRRSRVEPLRWCRGSFFLRHALAAYSLNNSPLGRQATAVPSVPLNRSNSEALTSGGRTKGTVSGENLVWWTLPYDHPGDLIDHSLVWTLCLAVNA